MSAHNFLESMISGFSQIRTLSNEGVCSCCGASYTVTLKDSNSFECLVCSFLKTPNPNIFGFLTATRAHSPTTFLNSILVFDVDQPLTLVTTENYAKNIPKSDLLEVLVMDSDSFIISNINAPPKKAVFIKPSVRVERYCNNILISDQRLLSLTSEEGVININIKSWVELLELIKQNDKSIILSALKIFEDVTKGGGPSDFDFIKTNYILFSELSRYLDVMPHSKLYVIKLLRRVANEA